MEINDNDILTYDTLIKLYEKNENNEFLKYLIDNKIIDGINYSGYKKIVEFISKKEIFEVYDNNFIIMLCRNFVLLYNDVDKNELYEPEEIYKIKSYEDQIESFYEIIDSGNLKLFNDFIDLISNEKSNKHDKLKLMIDVVSNFKYYIPLITEIVNSGNIDLKDKYFVKEILKYRPDYFEITDDYEEWEEEFYVSEYELRNIKSLEQLHQASEKIYRVKAEAIKNMDEDAFPGYSYNITIIKNEIVKLLTGYKYYGNETLDTIGISSNELKLLRQSIKDEQIKEELSKYILYMSFVDSILKIEDLKKLRVLAFRIAKYKQNSNGMDNIYFEIERMIERIKEIYSFEISEKLINFNQLEYGKKDNYSKTKELFTAENKKLYDEDISGRKVDFIELEGIDYVSLIHVLNAYGDGGTLRDFKQPRIVGKEYICLSAIDEIKTKIARQNKIDDEEHICLIFNNISGNPLISESSEDLYSDGDLNSLNIELDERENFRPIKKLIQKNSGSHTELVFYRNSENNKSIYPTGVLTFNNPPTQSEINAAAYLNVPIVFINREKYINRTNTQEINQQQFVPTSEDYIKLKESILELKESLNGKGKSK